MFSACAKISGRAIVPKYLQVLFLDIDPIPLSNENTGLMQ
jgi:hypothetical protein